jgi:hypothetical protein
MQQTKIPFCKKRDKFEVAALSSKELLIFDEDSFPSIAFSEN